ncbi:BldC family transcriptional regulator [Arcanobacterium ihumii]|uniref:BldC family transcriptional regulator n=1 Tax=Arcanobacterium ihumii TaxID=2138162 RepID=UPI000F540C67|nr:BldC family transcriptional regulator [Arcanobacterium ihumii]
MAEETINGELMTPAEVALLFRVDPKTVARWANSGKIPSIRTLGGHRRFRREDIERILNANTHDVEG